jgi:DNA-binding MarR family transcriptional regulator
MARWLDDVEQQAWRGLVVTMAEIHAALESDLQRLHGLTSGDYAVLVQLSEASERRMRMCDLASRLFLSPSGLTRRLDGLVRDGLVVREPSPEDRRVMLAVLTDRGMAVMERAAPDHVDGVRREVFDHLSAAQVRNLAAAFAAVQRGRERAAEAAAAPRAS